MPPPVTAAIASPVGWEDRGVGQADRHVWPPPGGMALAPPYSSSSALSASSALAMAACA